jgi:hypothetical protein
MLPQPSVNSRPETPAGTIPKQLAAGRHRHASEAAVVGSKQAPVYRQGYRREIGLFGHPLTRGAHADLFSTFSLSFLYIICSVGLVLYNNYLMDYGRFPHPTHLVWVQMVFISCFTALLLVTKPALFPTVGNASREKRLIIDRQRMLRGVLPVAVLLAISLVLSTAAYLHSSLVSWQLMREGGVAFTYLFSLYLSLDSFTSMKALLMFGVIAATSLTIYGGHTFSAIGFIMQSVAIMCESLRTTLQAKLLTIFRRLDVLTYVLLMMPTCMALLTLTCAAKDIFGLSETFAGPRQLDVVGWGPHLAANGCLAFLVSILQTCLMEYASPVMFSIVGIAKDTVVVCLALSLIKEAITFTQGFGFCLQLTGIFFYTLLRAAPVASLHKSSLGKENSAPALPEDRRGLEADQDLPPTIHAGVPHHSQPPIANTGFSPAGRHPSRAQV